jgi:ribosomal protein S12 methylthiotransferase accessory factor YcaO
MLTAATMLMPGMKIARAMLEALQARGSCAVGLGSTRGERVWVGTMTLLY